MNLQFDIAQYHQTQSLDDQLIMDKLYSIINEELPGSIHKIWHRHPVWFLDGNPIVGYSRQKAGVRLMFWSGADFEEESLTKGSGKFKDASVFYQNVIQIEETELRRWLGKSAEIQWDYKNLVKRKGILERL